MDKKYKDNPNTIDFINKFYDKLTPEKERFNKWMMPYLSPLIPVTDINVLEVGCGMGRDLFEVEKWCSSDSEIFGMDISIVAIEKAKEFYSASSIQFIWGDFGDVVPAMDEDGFDVVICSQTLEHVDYPEVAIKKMKKVTKKGGVLFITVPWPKSNLDNGVRSHYWRFYDDDFYKLLDGCSVTRDGNNMIVVWEKK